MPKICKVEGCSSVHYCKGYCNKHYRRVRRYGDPFAYHRLKRKRCMIDGCNKLATAKKLCPKHYFLFRKYGDPEYKLPNWIGCRSKYSKEYSSYHAMKTRCYNSNSINYQYYGGRGIGVCDRWMDKERGFVNFLEDMGKRPEGTTLDRIDPNGDYCPENCRWATYWEQNRNVRRRRKHTGVFAVGHKWHASLVVKGRRYEISASTEADAIKARAELERKYL